MTEITLDPYLPATRTGRETWASELRALFAVASRPEVIFLAGGYAVHRRARLRGGCQRHPNVLASPAPMALQYGGGQGLPALRERLVEIMRAEGVPAHPDDLVVTNGGQQGLDLVAKLFCDPGDVMLAKGPSHANAIAGDLPTSTGTATSRFQRHPPPSATTPPAPPAHERTP